MKIETIEGNKLIAKLDGKSKVHPNDLKYHSSYEWLMGVVEKVEETTIKIEKQWSLDGSEYSRFKVVIFNRCCDILVSNIVDDNIIEITAAKNKKEAIWLALIQFYKWYEINKNKAIGC